MKKRRPPGFPAAFEASRRSRMSGETQHDVQLVHVLAASLLSAATRKKLTNLFR